VQLRHGARAGAEGNEFVDVHGRYHCRRREAPTTMIKMLLLVIVVLIAYVLYLRTNKRR
jgi:hypothetical protein